MLSISDTDLALIAMCDGAIEISKICNLFIIIQTTRTLIIIIVPPNNQARVYDSSSHPCQIQKYQYDYVHNEKRITSFRLIQNQQ